MTYLHHINKKGPMDSSCSWLFIEIGDCKSIYMKDGLLDIAAMNSTCTNLNLNTAHSQCLYRQ